MDFLRKLLPRADQDGVDVGGEHVTANNLHDAYKVAERLADETREKWLAEVEPNFKNGKAMEATFTLFVAMWLVFAWLKHSVNCAIKENGPRSAVAKLWSLLEETFKDGKVEEGMLNLIRKHMGK